MAKTTSVAKPPPGVPASMMPNQPSAKNTATDANGNTATIGPHGLQVTPANSGAIGSVAGALTPPVAPAANTGAGAGNGWGTAGGAGYDWTLPPAPAPPTPKPSLLPPSNMPNYSSAFQAAMSAARGNIQDQLTGALADIANSQKQAGVALTQYAPMVNADYQEGMGGAASAAQAGDAAMKGAGFNPLGAGAANAYLAPDRAAVANTRTQDLADQALLNTGIQQQGEHENALANLAAQQANGQLDQSQMSFLSGMAAQQAGQQGQNQDAMALASQQEGFNNKNALRDFGYQQKLAAGQAQASKYSDTNPATGPYAGTGLTAGQVAQTQASPEYQRWAADLSQIDSSPTSQKNLNYGAVGATLMKLPANVQQVLKAENPTAWKIITSAIK